MSASEEKTAAAELRRSLELLWGTAAEPTRGPKPGLTVERVTRAAIELADTDGLAALSMRNLATALGVGTMTLYRYVPGRAELVALMVDEVCRENIAQAAPAGGWRERLEANARAEWAMYLRHPWVLHIAQGRPLLGPNAMDATEAAMRALDGTGMDPREKLSTIVLVSSFVSGLARTAVEATQAADATGISDEEWWEVHTDFLVVPAVENRHPMLSAAGEAGAWEAGAISSDLDLGLAILLDGIAARIAGRDGG